jgi:hypothetical protein
MLQSNFEPVRRLHIDYCGGTTLPAEGVDPANGSVLIQVLTLVLSAIRKLITDIARKADIPKRILGGLLRQVRTLVGYFSRRR